MEKLSFFEKLGILGQNILAHPIFICLLLLPVLLIFFNKKITKKAVVLIYIAVILVVLFVGNTTLFELFDNVVDGIFMTLYFPNFITLFIVEVLSAVITLITFLKKDTTKVTKIINITGFAIIQTLFCLVLTVIQVNDIDIYKENALYASSDVLTLMQLLMGTFALQIVTLVVVHAIDRITARLDAKENGTSIDIQKQIESLKETKTVLPEGRITHAKVEPEVKIIVKEPEVKLPPIIPVKPLDKNLIKEEKIEPINLNEEIIKEEHKPDLLKPMEDPKPFISPKTPIVKEVVKQKISEPISKSQDVKIPIISEPVSSFENFKLEYPEKKAPAVTEMAPVIKKEKLKPIETFIKPTPIEFSKVAKEVAQPSVVNETVALSEQKLPIAQPEPITNETPKSVVQAVPEQSQEGKELITNLEIIDFDKTVKAIKNLKTVYTL